MTAALADMPERRRALLGRDAMFNGVGYAEVRPGHIDVHFINRVRVKGTLARDRPPVTLRVSGAAPAPVVRPVDEDADWSTDTSGRPVLRVGANLPAAPARYLLTVHSDRIDPCLNAATITVLGDALGCGAGEAEPAGGIGGEQRVPVDYLAKDFTSFLTALSNFSAARYPLWAERSEADFGVMLMEVLSALADELSYLQDRVAAEATIGTATQRLSLVRHARLVDYEPMPALAARTVLQFDVAPAAPGSAALPDVIQVQALGGQAGTVNFAAGALFGSPVFGSPVFGSPLFGSTASGGPVSPDLGHADAGATARRALDARWNRYDQAGRVPQLVPYLWDPRVTRLRQGATSIWISGHGHGFYPGQSLLIDTAAAVEGDPANREIVRVTVAEERTDPVQGRPVTLVRLAEGLVSDHDLTRTEFAGNLLPAVHGQVTDEVFAIPGGPQPPAATPGGTRPPAVPLVIVRADHSDAPPHYRYTLAGPLAWQTVPAADGGQPHPTPVLTVQELPPAGRYTELSPSSSPNRHPLSHPNSVYLSGSSTWQWVPRLIDADGTARAFTVSPERYSPTGQVNGLPFADYDGDGATICFGDGTFGRPPAPGTTFRARYLVGGGDVGNVAADTIVAVAPGDPANGLVWRCTNPFAAAGGAGAETAAQVRDRAPQQVRSGTLNLAGPADYAAAARLFSPVDTAIFPAGDADPARAQAAWARQAVAAARWTGSWLTTTTIADPMADEPLAAQLADLAALADELGARRLAGSDTAVALARYRWLDLRITCATRLGYWPGDVSGAVLARLTPRRGTDGATGFFGRDKWTFGQPLEASALMAAIQSCPGVAGITRADYRWAGGAGEWRPLRVTLGIAPGEILRIDNDPDQPGHGLLFVTAEATR